MAPHLTLSRQEMGNARLRLLPFVHSNVRVTSSLDITEFITFQHCTMDQQLGPTAWKGYIQGDALRELKYQDERLVPPYNDHSCPDLQQYFRVVETAYISRGSDQSQAFPQSNWGGEWAPWPKYGSEPHSLSSNTLTHGPLTPDVTSFDETRTINPDSLIKPELEFGNPFPFNSSFNTPQDIARPISPTSPSRPAYQFSHQQYDGSSNNYFDILPNAPQSLHSQSSSIITPSVVEESASPGQVSQAYSRCSVVPVQIPSHKIEEEVPEISKKQGSKSESRVQGRRRRSKNIASNKHNQIEKRYRTNLNDKISALRDSVPSLRALMDGQTQDLKLSGGEESDEDCNNQNIVRRTSIAKAEVLSKATEYIHDLEKALVQMEKENKTLQAKVDASESPKVKKRGKRETMPQDGRTED